MSIITLTTDFGAEDAYVGTMKGVILSLNPGATIVDICHNIEPQNILQGAFVLDTAYPYFPPGTIHVVVVDPGVGTERRAIILKALGAFFVAPDNGVLSYVLRKAREFEVVSLTNPHFWLNPVSSTFHGRDIFAPVAAHLSLGVPLHEFGEPLSSPVTLPLPEPQLEADGSLIGHIIHIDRFGNLITDIKETDLPRDGLLIEASGYSIKGLSRSYAEGNEILALVGSSGNLEIAAKNGKAAEILKLRIGDQIKIKGSSA